MHQAHAAPHCAPKAVMEPVSRTCGARGGAYAEGTALAEAHQRANGMVITGTALGRKK